MQLQLSRPPISHSSPMPEVLRALLMASPTVNLAVDAVGACARLGLTYTPAELHALLLEAQAAGLAELAGIPDTEVLDGELVTTGVRAALTDAGRQQVQASLGGQF
jgi:hypothetical protein